LLPAISLPAIHLPEGGLREFARQIMVISYIGAPWIEFICEMQISIRVDHANPYEVGGA
jgi:hypothetical protein